MIPEDDEACPCGSGLSYAACHKRSDLALAPYRARGEHVPPRRMRKTPAQIEGCRKAGAVNSAVLDAVSKVVAEGITTAEIDDVVMRETRALGGKPACLGFEGFPKAVCTSVNEVVCHGIPSERCVLKEGDIVNVDCTTIYDGYFGDASRMYAIGRVSEEAKTLISVTEEAVKLAVSHLAPYTSHLGDIGYDISTLAHRHGFRVVREIGGHGVGLEMHEDPFVAHTGLKGRGLLLVPGMIFTIEPMINAGTARVYEDVRDGWTIRTADGRLSAQIEHEVLITETGHEILSK